MELLQPNTATVVARYKHPVWGQYAALTRNKYGTGEVTYLGFMPNDELRDNADAVDRAGVVRPSADVRFPIIIRSGLNSKGRGVHYLFNYSGVPNWITYPFEGGKELLSNRPITRGARINLGPWSMQIVEDDTR